MCIYSCAKALSWLNETIKVCVCVPFRVASLCCLYLCVPHLLPQYYCGWLSTTQQLNNLVSEGRQTRGCFWSPPLWACVTVGLCDNFAGECACQITTGSGSAVCKRAEALFGKGGPSIHWVDRKPLQKLTAIQKLSRFNYHDSQTNRFRNYHDSETTIQKLSRFRNYTIQKLRFRKLSRFRNYRDSETVAIKKLSSFRN